MRNENRLNDEDIDRELKELLAVDPSLEFEARVRLSASQQIVARWPFFQVAGVGIAAALAVMVLLTSSWDKQADIRRNQAVNPQLPPTTNDAQTSQAVSAPVPALSGPEAQATPTAARVVPPRQTVVEDMPQVMFSAADAAAYHEYLAAVNRHQFTLTPADVESLRAAAADVMLSPIGMEPLDLLNSSQDDPGVQQ